MRLRQLTWADLAFIVMSDWLSVVGADSQIDSYPKLKALHRKVTQLPKIAEWLSKRPQTTF